VYHLSNNTLTITFKNKCGMVCAYQTSLKAVYVQNTFGKLIFNHQFVCWTCRSTMLSTTSILVMLFITFVTCEYLLYSQICLPAYFPSESFRLYEWTGNINWICYTDTCEKPVSLLRNDATPVLDVQWLIFWSLRGRFKQAIERPEWMLHCCTNSDTGYTQVPM
jgi:hypothetical protein